MVAFPNLVPVGDRGALCMNPTVTWFDPGETIGWSIMQVDHEALVDPKLSIHESIVHWESGQIAAMRTEEQLEGKLSRRVGSTFAQDTSHESSAVQQMLELALRVPGQAVGTESFVVRRYDQSDSFLSPVRIMAAFDFACWMYGLQPYRIAPSEAKTAVTDLRLRRWGLYRAGQPHARDATRHVLTFLRKCKDLNKGRRRLELVWPHIYGKDYAWPSSRG